MSYQAGAAFVTISPDMTGFQDKVKAELATTEAQFAESGDKAGAAFGDAFQTQLKASLADLPDAVIKADADTTEADAELDEAAKTRTATVKVNVDKSSLSQAKTALSGIQESGSKLLGNAGTLGAATAVIGLAPQAAGAALGAAGIGVALGAAAVDAGAFGAIAVPMFTAVTKAQTALTTAQAAYNKATTDAGRAAALKAEQAALAGLTPSEQQLATQLTALSAAWKKEQDAEQPVVEGALTPWLQTAVSSMGLLTPLVDDGANAIQALGSQAQTALQSPFWQTFSTTLGQTGEDALTAFGEAAGSVGDGLAHLFVTFAPDIDKLLSDIPTLAGDFDTWAKSVTAGGLEDFFSKTFSHSNLSTLKGDLDGVGSFFQNVASATESMSPLAFNGLNVLLEAIGSLPPDAVIALTGLFLATKTIGAIGNIAGLAGNVINLGKAAAGALGIGAQAGEAATEGTAVGTAAGTAAATAFTGTFGTELTASLPTAFVSIGTELATAADAAGTVWGTAAATTFATAFGAEDALGVTAALTAVGTEASVEAGVAGAAVGTAFAGGVGESLGTIGTALAAALPEASLVAVLAAGLAGAALGTAVGTGFTLALAATGIGGAVSGIATDVKNGAASANTWLTPAGQQAALGFASGFTSEGPAVTNAAAQAKNWVTSGTAGSNAWLTPGGQQTGSGFNSGLASTRAEVNSTAASMKTWVTDNFQPAGAWLTNAGIDVVQGFANGIISGSSVVINAAESVANEVISIINKATGSASPSKKTFATGQWVGQGFGLGMLDQQSYVTQSALTLGNASVSALSGLASAQSLAALGVPSIGASPRLPGVSAPLSSGQVQLQVSYAGTSSQLTDSIVTALRFDIQGAAGGDAQAHLGSGPVRIPQ